MATRRHFSEFPKSARDISFSFACGGYLKMYLFGVAKALQEFDLEKNAKLLGCSAGALAAAGLALHRDYVLTMLSPKHATGHPVFFMDVIFCWTNWRPRASSTSTKTQRVAAAHDRLHFAVIIEIMTCHQV
ncbi:unnamed protein product [Phytophthora lilii]|uniref:Unnamed protein product n=1 Tax=Phytophthora lilii TaxID=2077276 RepID=A0A9W6X399_9STRA|nr:unnamed protein product [Phytophthora lilii]